MTQQESTSYSLWFSESLPAEQVLQALKPLQASRVGPGRVELCEPLLQVVFCALRLRDVLSVAGLRPRVQVGGSQRLDLAAGLGVVAVDEGLCVPVKGARWLAVGKSWVLVPEAVATGQPGVLGQVLGGSSATPWAGVLSSVPRPVMPGWQGLRAVHLWAVCAGASVVEVLPVARIHEVEIVRPRRQGVLCEVQANLHPRALRERGQGRVLIVLCEQRAHLPRAWLPEIERAEADGRVCILEAIADRGSVPLSEAQALLVALTGVLGDDATEAVVREVLQASQPLHEELKQAVEQGWLLWLGEGRLRVSSQAVWQRAWRVAAEPALRALQRWAVQRGDRPSILLAIARAQGREHGVEALQWLEQARELGDWTGILAFDRASLGEEQLLLSTQILIAAAQAQGDASVLDWLRERMARSAQRPQLSLVAAEIAAHPEVGDGAALQALLRMSRSLEDDPTYGAQRQSWLGFCGRLSPADLTYDDLCPVVMVRMYRGRFHGAIADLNRVDATRFDPLGLQHSVHYILSLGLVSKLSAARREIVFLQRRAAKQQRGDGLRLAEVLGRWVDALSGESVSSTIGELPRGGGARVLSDVLSAEQLFARGEVAAAAELLGSATPRGGAGLLDDVACGRAARLAALLTLQDGCAEAEAQRWIRALRARMPVSVLAHLRLLLAEELLASPRGRRRGVERLTGALESAVSRGLRWDARWLREALTQHPALSSIDRAVVAGLKTDDPAMERRSRPRSVP